MVHLPPYITYVPIYIRPLLPVLSGPTLYHDTLHSPTTPVFIVLQSKAVYAREIFRHDAIENTGLQPAVDNEGLRNICHDVGKRT